MKRSVLLLSILTAGAVAAAGTELGVKGTQFTVKGELWNLVWAEEFISTKKIKNWNRLLT